MTLRYRAVFLDVGDTLLHAEPSWYEIIVRVAAERGVEVRAVDLIAAERALAPEIAARFASGERHTASLSTSQAFWTWAYDNMLERCGVEARARSGVAAACHVAFNDFASWVAFPDVAPLLEALDERRATGLHVGVLSNWEEWLAPLLRMRGLDAHFDALSVSGEIGFEKPDAAIFDHALAAAGLDRRSAHLAVHVGDSWAADVRGARAAGIAPVWIDRDGRATPDRLATTTIVRGLAELPALIDQVAVRP